MSTVARGLVGGLVLQALLTGCARGPVLSESAQQLKADTRSVLGDGAKRLGAPHAAPVVLTDATRPCRNGQAQQIFRGQISLRRGGSTSVTLDHAADVTLEMIRERGYRLERPPTAGHRTFTMARELPEVRLTVRLRGGRQPLLVLDGITPCLPS
ncbi:hypothetical protein [Actinomadura sp. HBU206391]|uniref:hypothetical protein n=1 Tax=Actinomadura sp. HBU206391 TaxID=2731692 RepID=UPI00164F282D|nr:hypothetical protein [Actinomadura sp. HBU206391]MBC6458064.1 hypothetical protein [Actinomadura sp. HBU206391]